MPSIQSTSGTRRIALPTGNVTLLNAGTATAGQILAVQWNSPGTWMRLRALEVEFILTTAFTAAQEVGCDVTIANPFSIAATGGTAHGAVAAGLYMGGRARSTSPNSLFSFAGDIRIATTADVTAGTHTLDAKPVARTSAWMAAIGAGLYQRFDFTAMELGGLIFDSLQGFVVRNSILMGAVGVGRWTITPEWDEVVLAP